MDGCEPAVNNPYEAPKSDVRDVEFPRLLAERPRQIVYATLSFWLSFLISIPLIAREMEKSPDRATVAVVATAFIGLLLAFLAAANVAVWRGRNWGRIVFLIFSLLSVVSFVADLRETLRSTGVEITLTVISTGLDVVVSCLLFTQPGALWFQTAREA